MCLFVSPSLIFRFVGIIGELVHELSVSGSCWEEEVVELLEDNRAAILGDGKHEIGNSIVGSALKMVDPPEACELFYSMAAAAEDIPIPMTALELIWRAYKAQPTPLGRFEVIQLRRWCFQLLDRNLVLGETSSTGGIQMHDGTCLDGQPLGCACRGFALCLMFPLLTSIAIDLLT